MITTLLIESICDDPVINISLDTLKLDKQALVFCNSKRGAEKQAEDISKKVKSVNLDKRLIELADKFENVLASPTKQCIRDANCIRKGIAFHHAGLVAKQRELIENNFRTGIIKIICSTPTLAVGLDMPAFRTILKDLKRYSGKWGYQYIQVLEYEQMAGRAGRPGKETYGEAIAISKNESELETLKSQYIYGVVENIQSKLAVEPVLRTYVLSLLVTGFVKTKIELINFFEKTFYAKQFGDMTKLEKILDKVISQLKDWDFVEISNTGKTTNSVSLFYSANETFEDLKISPTKLGKRISELYLDPYTANCLIDCLKNADKSEVENMTIGILHSIVNTIEMEPLLVVKKTDIDSLNLALINWEKSILCSIPSEMDWEYEDFFRTIKTTLFFNAWINETDEEIILEKFNMRPGETRAKLDLADWLLRCCIEICKTLGLQKMISPIYKVQVRLNYGVKEELLPLLKLKGIGRVRSRILFNNGFKDIGSFKTSDSQKIKALIGDKLGKSIYDQIGLKLNNNDLTDFI